MKTYEGKREGYVAEVTVNGRPLNPRLDLRNHSPSGFEWGYGGSGPAQLALAILADCVGDVPALCHYQKFKGNVIALLPYKGWTITDDQVREALASSKTYQKRS